MSDDVILHLVVVGFHHKKGSQIEYVFPPFEKEEPTKLPQEWSNLPSLALPDGAHNIVSDVVYFLLPSRDDPAKVVYGISCYRQIESAHLVAKTDDVTRNTVLKSVCVISTVPLFGCLKLKISLLTEAYFNERDFSQIDVLAQMYQNLLDVYEREHIAGDAAVMDISTRELVQRFRHSIIVLFKLLLLEKRVIFSAFPVQLLGDTMLALASLCPRVVEEGLLYSGTPPHQEPEPEKVQEEEEEPKIEVGVEASTSQPELTDPLADVKDGFGFPLSIFTTGNLFHPYASINFLDTIRSTAIRGYTIGVTNQVFLQRKGIADVVVTIDDKNFPNIDIRDPELRRVLKLTNLDARFGDYLLKSVEQNYLEESAWQGSDEWVRLQFKNYLISLAFAARSGNLEKHTDFFPPFVAAWMETNNYRILGQCKAPELSAGEEGHVGATLPPREIGMMIGNAIKSNPKLNSFVSWFKAAATSAASQMSAAGEMPNSNSNFYLEEAQEAKEIVEKPAATTSEPEQKP